MQVLRGKVIGPRSHWYHVAEVGFTLVAHVFSTLSPFLKEVLNPQGACKSKGVWEVRKAHTHTNTVQDEEITIIIEAETKFM